MIVKRKPKKALISVQPVVEELKVEEMILDIEENLSKEEEETPVIWEEESEDLQSDFED
jgi:hypothetical protein